MLPKLHLYPDRLVYKLSIDKIISVHLILKITYVSTRFRPQVYTVILWLIFLNTFYRGYCHGK